jgi:uncharacterized membrane protein
MIALKAGLYAGVIFLVIDLVWLGVVAPGFFKAQLGPLMREKIDFVPAVAFYVIYIAALVWLAILPAFELDDWGRAALNGAVLGLAAYATYDLTNLAVLKNWPLTMTLVDLAWGTALSALTAGLTIVLLKAF